MRIVALVGAFGLLVSSAGLGVMACAGAGADAGGPVVAPVHGVAPSPVDPDATASPAPTASAAATTDAGRPKLCGCSLCEPLPSEDACTTDADCAPETPCHAARCVAKSKATPRQPGLMCTEIMKCDTTDANGCGCVQGRCTLFPRRTK